MSARAQLELRILAAAVVLGVLADALLRTFPWGLNLCLWMATLATIVALHTGSRKEALSGASRWLPLLVSLFALVFAWRDSVALKTLSFLASLTALSLIMLRAQGGRIRFAGLAEYAAGATVAGLNAGFGLFLLLFGDAEWSKALNGRSSRPAMAAIRGTLFALPCLLVFGGLFMGADAVFNHIVRNTLRVNWPQLFSHLLVLGFFAWCSGGYLRGMLWGQEMAAIKGKRRPSLSLGAIEGGVMLGILDVLFLAFVAVQIRYFFGGSALVQATTGLTYAEYARRGFFSLFGVTVLVLPLLLIVHWLMAQRGPEGERVFRLLGAVQILLLFVVMASAARRMQLYQAEYGLTEERLYATAFMGWLAAVFLWFTMTVLAGRRDRFAFGALVTGFGLVIVLQALNPDALIAYTNLERAKAGRRLDVRYATLLSADAVPAVVAGLQDLTPPQRCAVASEVLKRWPPWQSSDWRTWNWSQMRAIEVVRANARELTAMQAAKCPPQEEVIH